MIQSCLLFLERRVNQEINMSDNEKNQEMLEQLKDADNKESEKQLKGTDNKKKSKPTNGDGHVLTPAEIKRQELFDKNEKEILAKGYKRKDIITTVLKANFVGILLTLPFVLLVVGGFILRNGFFNVDKAMADNPVLYFVKLGIIMIATGLLAVVHEKIHGWFWSIGAKNGSKDIEFGFQKENLTPYCTCKSPLSKKIYILGSMMPMTILGVVLGIVSIFVGSWVILAIAAIQIIGGSGDILITSMLLRYDTKNKDVILIDHPTKIGLVAFEKDKETAPKTEG